MTKTRTTAPTIEAQATSVATKSPLAFVVQNSDPRDRLDKLVVALLERASEPTSRATAQRWIEHGRVLVDGKPFDKKKPVAVGVRVEITPEAEPSTTAVPDASIALNVVYEDEHLLVVDKPAGLVVHPAKGHAEGTLVNALLGRGGFERAAADPLDPEGHLRPGIVHRIDKDTSGLLVVAKDAATREGLKALFAKHDIEREYVALVVGRAHAGTIESLHGRHPTDRLRFTSFVDVGKHAVTHVAVLEQLGLATLVACTLQTGRTHQIRVHLAERMKTPILGDRLYGKTPRDPSLRAIAEALGRQALHARVLGFEHPISHKRLRFESPIPEDMRAAIEALRAARATRSST